MKNKAFTLIELLVVVLIIGILASIAVPQYQYAVLKSKYHTMMNITKSIKDAQEVYFLQNGKYASHFSDLDININEGELYIRPNDSIEILKFNNKNYDIILSVPNQIAARMYKNDEEYMDYDLRLNNANMWNGANAICVSWKAAGSLGQKICNNLTNNPESCESNSIVEGRYVCHIH